MLKRTILAVLTAVSIMAVPAFASAATEAPRGVNTSGPWTVSSIYQDQDGWQIEVYKVDRDLAAWTMTNSETKQRRLYAYNGAATTLLATMVLDEWKDDGYFYDPINGNFDAADGLVVWTQKSGTGRTIHIWDGSVTKEIKNGTSDAKHPITSRGRIAWTGYNGSAYSLYARDAAGNVRRVDSWNVLNYAYSGDNLYWLNKRSGENWFRVFCFNGRVVTPIGEGDDRPLTKYFFVDRNNNVAWEYSTKRWDYDKRITYVSEKGKEARRAIQRDVPPNVTRLEDMHGGEVMLNVTDLLTTNLQKNVGVVRTTGYTEKFNWSKDAPTKARYVAGGVVRSREPYGNTALMFNGDAGGEDFLTLEAVITDRFESDGNGVVGALLKGGVLLYADKQTTLVTSTIQARSVAMNGGCAAWIEGEMGKAQIKMACPSLNVRATDAVRPVTGYLAKVNGSSVVYLLAHDGRRYSFPNETIFYGWYPNYRSVRIVSGPALASYQLGGNVLAKPGTILIKGGSSKEVYAVGKDSTLHWVKNGDVLKTVYGAGWQSKLMKLSDAQFANYNIGASAGDITEYNVVMNK